MSNGFNLGVLTHISDVTKDATPQYKVEPYGFLASLYLAHSPGSIKNDTYDGHKQTVKIKRKKRVLPSETKTEASCETTSKIPYTEDTVSVAGFRQYAFHIEDEVIAQYEKYASANKAVPGSSPANQVMAEFLDDIFVSASAIISAVNQDLVTLAAANMGVNRSTGVNTALPLNIARNVDVVNLVDGVPRILSDYRLNNMRGVPVVIGAGYMNAWMMSQVTRGLNSAGIDTRVLAQGLDFFYDNDWATTLGSNTIGVYERNSVQIVEYLEYQAWKAGQKPGSSFFGTLTLPMQTWVGQKEVLVPVKFDYQLKYNECPETLMVTNDEGEDEEMVLQKGYNLIISKRFGLYTIPADAYKVGDVLEGNRGSLLYDVTNDCESCEEVESY